MTEHQTDLLDYLDRYPHAPGFKVAGGTSERAAYAMRERAPSIRERALAAITASPNGLTADEVAEQLGVTPFACRPRLSELVAQMKIKESGRTRENASGKLAAVMVKA